MKKSLLFAAATATLAFTIASCSKNNIEPANPGSDDSQNPDQPEVELIEMTFSAETENSDSTKVVIGDLLSTSAQNLWQSGDAISVFDGSGNQKFTRTETTTSKDATFTGSAASGIATYYSLYPYQSEASLSRGVISCTIPTEQTANSSAGQGDVSMDTNVLLAVAKSGVAPNNTSLRFKNLYSLIIFEVDGNAAGSIASVTVEGNNRENIAGGLSVSFDNAGEPVINDGAAPAYYVTLKPNGGSGTFAAGKYAIAVRPGTLTNGYRLILRQEGSAKGAIATINKSKTLTRNSGINTGVGGINAAANNGFKYYLIYNKADMDEWNNDASNWDDNTLAYLMADIDYGAESDNWDEHDQKGTFNGRGHSITGFKSPLFNNIYGSVNNLTLTSNVTYSSITGSNFGVGLLGKYAYNGDKTYGGNASISGITVNGSITLDAVPSNEFGLGGILGSSNGCPMTNCTNNAAVNVSGEFTFQLRVGGVVGQAQTANITYENCINNGNISIGNKDGQGNITYLIDEANCYIGGCFGYDTKSNTYKGCKNTGRVDVYAQNCADLYVGGVFAHLTYNSKVLGSITNPNTVNEGTVYVVSDNGGDVQVGGIVSYTDNGTGYNVQIKDVENKGSVYLENSSLTNRAYVGGVVGYINNKTTFSSVSNSGDITTDAVSVAEAIHLGGVIGAHANTLDETFTGLSNSGKINTWNLTKTTTGATLSCFGGIEGGKDGIGGKTYSNCSNIGEMTIKGGKSDNKNSARAYIGGIVGYTNKNPKGSSCNANITVLLYHYTNTDSKSCIGGICGLWDVADVSDLKYEGTLQSTGSSPAAYISGIVGRTQPTTGTFTNCRIGGKVSGAGSSPFAGLFMTHNKANTINFSGCKVKKGTSVKKSSNVTISSVSDLTLGNFCGYPTYVSTGEISDCSVVDSLD